MNKFTKITTALCLAGAFCGMCIGCANNIKEEQAKKADAGANTAVVTATNEPRVILSPGYYYSGNTKKLNTVADGATALTTDEAKSYFIENAYFATVGAGETLPDAVTEREGTTFAGWTYALDGVVVNVDSMPWSLDDDLYLYAKWEVDGSVIPGGGGDENPDIPPVGAGITVNGKAMTKNTAASGEEYMILEAEFNAGDVLVFKNDETAIAVSEVEAASTGIKLVGGKVTVEKTGKFDLYLKKNDGKWTLYGSRKISAEDIEREADDVTGGNCYLVGNMDGTDATWTNCDKKGFKATLSGGYYELTVKLTMGDNVKFVKYGSKVDKTNADWWSSNLKAGSDGTAIKNATDNDRNMIVQKTGTYTFKVDASGASHTIEFTYTAE